MISRLEGYTGDGFNQRRAYIGAQNGQNFINSKRKLEEKRKNDQLLKEKNKKNIVNQKNNKINQVNNLMRNNYNNMFRNDIKH